MKDGDLYRTRPLWNIKYIVSLWIATMVGTFGCSKPPKDTVPEIGEPGQDSSAKIAAQAAPTAGEEVNPIVVENAGLKTPESILYDAQRDLYLVSNIHGSPLEKDNNGFISQLAPDGKVSKLQWITGGQNGVTLNAPKGMTIVKGVLYVTDIDVVRMFDYQTGAPKGEIAIAGATFLNDLTTADDDTVYVSDTGWKGGANGFENTGTDAIWSIRDGKAAKVVAKAELNNPNGLLASNGILWMVNGKGELVQISKDGTLGAPVVLPGGGLDGIVRTTQDTFLVSSWAAKAVFQGTLDSTFSPVAENIPSPADIGYDAKRNRLLIPVFTEDKVNIIPLLAGK